MNKISILLGIVVLLFATTAFGAVNVNTATAEELQRLEGIGDVKAQAIVEYRKQHGDFDSLSDLIKVDGVGDATVKAIRGEATVGSDNGDDATGSDNEKSTGNSK